MGEFPGSLDCFVDRSRVFADQNSQSVIVLHGTGGANPNQTAQQLGNYFDTNAEETSVHYGIDRLGVCCQYVLEQDGAAGNCCLEPGYDPFWDRFNGDNLNTHTFSIEHENNIDNSLALTPAQQATSFRLVAYLIKKYGNIPIKTHASIAPINRAHCPGNYPMAALQAYLAPKPAVTQPAWMSHASLAHGGTKAVVTISKTQAASFLKTWNQSTHTSGYGSGIGLSWQEMQARGYRIGPPTTDEYDDTDWHTPANPIKARQFSDVRCEWQNNKPRWFGPYGEIIV